MESNGTVEELVAQLEAANKGKATADTEVCSGHIVQELDTLVSGRKASQRARWGT